MQRYNFDGAPRGRRSHDGEWVLAYEAESRVRCFESLLASYRSRIRELESERDEAYALATERDDLARRVYAMSHAILDLLLAEQEHGPYSDEFNTAKKAAKRLATEAAEAAAKGGE